MAINYTQTAGAATVNNTSLSFDSFDLGISTASVVNISGGAIVLQCATYRNFRNQADSGIVGVTGGTLQAGKNVMKKPCFVPTGGVFGDPFAGIEAGRNTFTISSYGG